jgi:hypothetical protein
MNPVTKHVPQSAQIVMRWRGWYQAPQIYYVCSCGRRLKKYGEHTITHFQPDIVGYAAVCRQLDALQVEAEAADAARQASS